MTPQVPTHVGDQAAVFLLMFVLVLLVLCCAAGIEAFFGGVRDVNQFEEDDEPIYSDPAHRPRW